MATKSRTTEVLAAVLASNCRVLNRRMLGLVYLRQMVAEKENAAVLKCDGASGRPLGEAHSRNRGRAESCLWDSQKASTHELPEKSRKFLESFLADRGSLF